MFNHLYQSRSYREIDTFKELVVSSYKGNAHGLFSL